jgi:hemoglobin-like flavoprotein
MGLQIEVLRNSFAIVAEREPELTHRFYEVLFENYPQTRAMFRSRTRNSQERMLTDALLAVLEHLEDGGWLTDTLAAMGATHATYGVTEEMYDWVGECLLQTLGEAAAAAWTPDVAGAWTEAYGAIAGLMKQGARTATSSIGIPPTAALEGDATSPY